MASVVLALILAFVWAQPASYSPNIQKFRADSEAELKADDGWLTVAGLFWLKPGQNARAAPRAATSSFPPALRRGSGRSSSSTAP